MIILKQYFRLQWIMLKRHLKDFGLNPIAGLAIIIILFFGFSYFLFTKTKYANYLYVAGALSLIGNYNERSRNDLLKFIFPRKQYFKVRILENLMTVLPFILFLCFKKDPYSILLLFVLSTFIVLLNAGNRAALTIPTPFYKKPFEFIIGFRIWIPIFLFTYFMTIMSLTQQNFNLGIFSLVLIFLVCVSFYNKPEEKFYVWIHKLKVNRFLFEKVGTAIVFSTMLSLPIALALGFFFQTNVLIILALLGLGYCYLLLVILAKYSAYPHSMDLQRSILLAIGIMMPPFLLILVPFFYLGSVKKLKEILE